MRAELGAQRGGPLWLAREAWPEPLPTSYAALLERDDAHLVVGCLDDAPVGFGAALVETLTTGARLGVVTDLFVEEPAREVGVGEAVLDALVQFCSTAGCSSMDARALPGNRAAKNFFETHGFTARALVVHRELPRTR